jgi:hypothetical protein
MAVTFIVSSAIAVMDCALAGIIYSNSMDKLKRSNFTTLCSWRSWLDAFSGISRLTNQLQSVPVTVTQPVSDRYEENSP